VHALALRVELRIPLARSLKDKRAVLRPLLSGLRKFEVAVAEVDFQDEYRRAGVGVAMVSGSSFQLEKQRHAVERWLYARPDVEVLTIEPGYMEPE